MEIAFIHTFQLEIFLRRWYPSDEREGEQPLLQKPVISVQNFSVDGAEPGPK